MKEKRLNWPVLLLVAALATIVIVLAALYGVSLYKSHQEKKLLEYVDFSDTYSVYALTSSLSEPGEQMTLTFDGQKNGRGEFRGDIAICNGSGELLDYNDCELIYTEEGTYAMFVYNDWSPDLDVPRPNDISAVFYADADWCRLALVIMDEESKVQTDYVVFAGPASNHVEAYHLYMELL